jgi:hypothetical protein
MGIPHFKAPACKAFALAGLVGLALALAPAARAEGVRVGFLRCDVSAGIGLILGSSRAVNCKFSPAEGHAQRYTGKLQKYGLDIGYVDSAVMVWAVVAPNWTVPDGALAGEYVGGTASATVGVGVGANALIGGGNKSFALQPVSVEGSTGINVAAGVGRLSLSFAGAE